MSSSPPHYEVAICGGGIAGLTLALIFEKLDISYVLFEARETLEPGKGAGVGLQPNGMRILEQLGVLQDVEDCTVPLSNWCSMEADGQVITKSSAIGQYLSRTGYAAAFIERRQLIRIMAEHVRQRDHIHTSSRVAAIQEFQDHVQIRTENGRLVTADLLIGGDGVNSCVRKFIDNSVDTKKSEWANDDMGCSYSTTYGMSSRTAGIEPGQVFSVYREKNNLIGFGGKEMVFWFVNGHLPERHSLSESPRFTLDESEALCTPLADVKILPGMRFGELFANKIACFMVPAEEGVASHWHTSRVAIIGDAACKMTPAGGQGANQAMESCVALANELAKVQAQSSEGRFSRQLLEAALERYTQQRLAAGKVALQRSQMILKSLFCYPGQPSDFRKMLPNTSDEDFLKRAFAGLAKAPVLDGVELSERGHQYNVTCQAALASMMTSGQRPPWASREGPAGGPEAQVSQRAAATAA